MEKVAILGSTGGIGQAIVEALASENELILIDRNLEKSRKLAEGVVSKFPNAKISHVQCDLMSVESVKNAVKNLKTLQIDTLILNAGIYNVKVENGDTGFNNVFQVNFVMQYYIARQMLEFNPKMKLIAMGSIAYKGAKLNENDVDYSKYKNQTKIYGNSKRLLMFSLMELKNEFGYNINIVHPGITLTHLTGHYKRWINWLVKLGMKLVFPSPKKACKSVLFALKTNTKYMEWIGPKIFDIWGSPSIKPLKHCSNIESKAIKIIAENIYFELCKNI